MPIFTTTISQQQTGISAGASTFPMVGMIHSNAIIQDFYNRETLQPAGSYTLYSTVVTGTGTAVPIQSRYLQVQTSATLNDTIDCRTSGLSIGRTLAVLDTTRNSINFTTTFGDITLTNIQGFFGFIASSTTSITALPTTAQHIGVYVDTSVSNNYKLSWSDGTTQSTKDTGIALGSGHVYSLNILWNGDNTATVTFNLLNTDPRTGFSTSSSLSITTLTSTQNTFFEFHQFVKTLTAASATSANFGWTSAS